MTEITERPWGTFQTISESEDSATKGGYRVKRITVKPEGKLSLQKHQYRAEHWVVVKGVAEVTCDGKVFILEKNQSTFIPLGAVHRLYNPGQEILEMIEVQIGDKCAEEDIIRLEDVYGRN